jgi:hypothetical protein
MSNQSTAGAFPDYIDLFECGEVLDAVDAGMEEVEVSRYRDLLKKARNFILEHWGHPKLEKECLRSGALFDLYSYTEFEKRLAPKLALLRDDTIVSVYSYAEAANGVVGLIAV